MGRFDRLTPPLQTPWAGSPRSLPGELFAQQDRGKIQEAYSQMLLLGRATPDAHGRRLDGGHSSLEVLMVAIHDHKMRFVGHHCLVVDRTREKVLKAQVEQLTKSLEQRSSVAR